MILREMLVDDLDQVMEIEQDLFHVPWTKEGFFTFLTKENTMFFVIEEKEKISARSFFISYYFVTFVVDID